MKFLLPLLLILLSACGSTKEKNTDKEPKAVLKAETELAMPINLPDPGPDQCRITGTIVSVLPVSSEKNKGLCANHACKAVVKILKVIAKGNSFKQPITETSELTVHFEFTLEPTAGLVPELEQALPGLKVGDSFETILSAPGQKMGMESTPVIYKAFTYNRL
ncbi:MAG: hypothetical protein J0L62_13615 [Bacteroidetes bacterium]|nr:hypothetical protein [Bacteroidota bacterium]